MATRSFLCHTLGLVGYKHLSTGAAGLLPIFVLGLSAIAMTDERLPHFTIYAL
jgi:hypothetical protein